MLLHYFQQVWRSTRKTLLIFHGTRQVSPDFYLFHNFWKEKWGLPYPDNQTFWFLVNFIFFDYMSTHVLELSYILDQRILPALVK